jgi:hypothetical protein
VSGGGGSLTGGIASGFIAFTKRICSTESPDLLNKLSAAAVLGIILMVLVMFAGLGLGAVDESIEAYKFDHLSPAQHLAQAETACGNGSQCLNALEAAHHLSNIPGTAPEYRDAMKLLAEIQEQQSAGQAAAIHDTDDARARSWEKAQSNFQNQAQDSFICATSSENEPIVSFDDGTFWWKDDGRCARRLQKKKDEDAQTYSYWSTTVRVNTDMDSFWLPDEERTCQTFPDDKGRVATVTCDATAHAIHNIPVKFWGGVDRDTVSDWKCRREKDVFEDVFVCRAID